jgi:hypothetical protein
VAVLELDQLHGLQGFCGDCGPTEQG